MHALLLATLAAASSAMPSYIAVPADQIAFVDLSALRVRRVPRQTLTPPPLPNLYSQDYQPVPILPYQNQYPPNQNQYQQNQNQYQQNQNQYQPNQNLYQAIQQEPVALNRPQEAQGPERLLRLQQPQESASLASSQQLAERPPDFGEFVDFGAHTGDNGAFGWYADYPINNHDDHSSYRK